MLNNKISLVINSEFQEKGNLYVGGYDSLKKIQQYNIGAVLSAIWIQKIKTNKNLKHLIIAADDSPNYKMSKHFEEAVEFIHENLQTTNVLVHCAMGISRSVCLIIAYMIKTYKVKPQDVLVKIREIRPQAGPNEGFTQELENYYMEVMEGIEEKQ